MPRTIRRERATRCDRGDAHPLFVRTLSSFTPPQQRLLRALLEADRPRPAGGAGGAASRGTP